MRESPLPLHTSEGFTRPLPLPREVVGEWNVVKSQQRGHGDNLPSGVSRGVKGSGQYSCKNEDEAEVSGTAQLLAAIWTAQLSNRSCPVVKVPRRMPAVGYTIYDFFYTAHDFFEGFWSCV